MTSKRISYTVKGEVQGVSFRYYTCKEARKVGVTGFVTNASDGTVQGEAQGDENAIEDFLHYLHKGPSAASVTGVEQSDMATKADENGFSQK
ncbi:Acylphosphatase [Pleomassaria siparia CBS 279.74]|uniref:acylphosphatase n=1 Tax=Pleomassaria siparia CBS 279.74 TaxID=1314801 RepID=A0A6G1KGQ3_9PLEO|nr:Acylphosphatase [Pleomassaria siparia CBS 279.74]